ncbi:MAG: hypothetical protein ACREYC_05055 [Gammaproteobacteria bacterium]
MAACVPQRYAGQAIPETCLAASVRPLISYRAAVVRRDTSTAGHHVARQPPGALAERSGSERIAGCSGGASGPYRPGLKTYRKFSPTVSMAARPAQELHFRTTNGQNGQHAGHELNPRNDLVWRTATTRH